MSLRVRIALAMAVLAAVVTALASAGAYFSADRQLGRSVDDSLVTRARAAVSAPQRTPFGDEGRGPDGGRALRCPDVIDLQSLAAAQLVDADGTVTPCIDGGATITPTERDLALAAGEVDPDEEWRHEQYEHEEGIGGTGGDTTTVAYRLSTTRIGDEGVRVVTMAFPRGGAIQLARSIDEAGSVLDRLRAQLALIAGLGIVLAAGIGFLLATRIVRPIRRLTDTAEHIAATRDLSTAVPSGGSDEIGSLAASFTTMVESLAESQDQQRQLISDASHEMRTPLTSLRTNLELLERAEQASPGTLSDADRRAVLDDLRFETAELTALLTELVELATDRANAEPLEPVDLGALCAGVVDRARRRSGREFSLIVEGPAAPEDGSELLGRPHLLERAVSNLVDNAVKYAGDSAIEIVVTGRRVEVRDHGPGVAVEDRPRVFDRFYRATSARTAPGSGLGLAIVAQIVGSHSGQVFVTDRPDGAHGAVVGFELPD